MKLTDDLIHHAGKNLRGLPPGTYVSQDRRTTLAIKFDDGSVTMLRSTESGVLLPEHWDAENAGFEAFIPATITEVKFF